MQRFVRLMTCAALVGAIACNDSTRPQPLPLRADLNGFWQCAEASVFYHNHVRDVREWRTAGCLNYLNITDPSRADSIETKTFLLDEDDRVRRIDFLTGRAAYDSTTGELEVQYSNRVDIYQASLAGLVQRFEPWDYTGDGELDSLILVFRKPQ